MQNLQLCRTCPREGCSIAHKVMDDAVAYHLANGGPAVARSHLENLANELKFYSDFSAAYCDAVAKINDAEKAEQEQAEKRRQEQLQQMLSVFSSIKTESSLISPISNKKAKQAPGDGSLPPKLSTEKAMLMWQRLQQAGMIDDHYQPVGLSRTESAWLADYMATQLKISNKWKTFEELWHRKSMRSDYNDALELKKIPAFDKKVKKLLL